MAYIPERKRNAFDTMVDRMMNSSFDTNTAMRTDIRRKDDMYYLDIELPGYTKEDIRISLYNGTLTIQASHTETSEEKESRGNVIRRERYSGSLERSFRVGTAIRESDVKASFTDGVLTIEIPSEEKKEREEKRFIDIL